MAMVNVKLKIVFVFTTLLRSTRAALEAGNFSFMVVAWCMHQESRSKSKKH